MNKISASLLVAGVVACAPASWAAAIISSGPVTLGVHDFGNLGTSNIGITFDGIGDGVTPGCDCEGWGVSAGSLAAWASIGNGGFVNVALNSFTSTANTAASVVGITTIPGLTVTHAFAPASAAPGSLFEVVVTIANGGATTLNDVRYTRAVDWDVPPSEFWELVTLERGNTANLLFSNDNGFATPNPLINPASIVAGTNNVSFSDAGPEDHGAFFTFGFGSLAAGSSRSFRIYFGAADSQGAALASLAAVGAQTYTLGQSDGNGGTGEPVTYMMAFSGLDTNEVPEPSTVVLLGAGLVLAAWRRRFRHSSAIAASTTN